MTRSAPRVGAPLPDIGAGVVEAETVRPVGVDRSRAEPAVVPGVVGRERALPDIAAVLPSGTSSWPQGKRRPCSPPRAANSHSVSVGRRPPAHFAYAVASVQETCVTGWSSRVSTGDPGPSGRTQEAPGTASHHEVPPTGWASTGPV